MLKMISSKMLGRHRDGKWWTMTHAFYADLFLGAASSYQIPPITTKVLLLNEEFEYIDAEEIIQDKSKKDIFVTTDHNEKGPNEEHIDAESYIDTLPDKTRAGEGL
ncbi:hypothetical protein V8E54_011062 [Elaphomyces granulatus]